MQRHSAAASAVPIEAKQQASVDRVAGKGIRPGDDKFMARLDGGAATPVVTESDARPYGEKAAADGESETGDLKAVRGERKFSPNHPALKRVFPSKVNPKRMIAIWKRRDPIGSECTVRLVKARPASHTKPSAPQV